MSNKLKFFKVNTLPVDILADSIYIYRDSIDRVTLAVTNANGVIIYLSHNTESILDLISNYINNIINQPDGIAGLDINGKVLSSTIKELIEVSDLLTYNSVSGSGSIALKTTISNPANGQQLKWKDGDWVNENDLNIILTHYSGNVPQMSGTTQITVTSNTPTITEGTQVFSYTLTPKSTNSKFIIQFAPSCHVSSSISGRRDLLLPLFRGSTFLTMAGGANPANAELFSNPTINFIDAPNTTNPITYSVRIGTGNGIGTWYIGRIGSNSYGGNVPSSWSILEVKE